jgi:hypothetical protein
MAGRADARNAYPLSCAGKRSLLEQGTKIPAGAVVWTSLSRCGGNLPHIPEVGHITCNEISLSINNNYFSFDVKVLEKFPGRQTNPVMYPLYDDPQAFSKGRERGLTSR